jgi:PAS domain S-box-containing protein
VPQLSLRRILLLIVGTLTLFITLLAAKDVYGDWQRLTRIRALRDAAVSSDQFFDATQKLAVERDVALSMLYAPDSETIDELRIRLKESRQAADAALRATVAELNQYTFPDLVELRKQVETHLLVIPTLRPEIDRAVGLPHEQRNPDLPDRWSGEVTALMSATENLWIGFVSHFTDVDPIVTQHLLFKHLLRTITDYTGRERSLVGRLITENSDPTPEQIGQLLRGRGIVETDWQMSRMLADQSGLFPAIGPRYSDASSHYFTMRDMLQNLFYVPDARHGATYPIGVDLWFELSTQASDSLGALRESSISETRNYVEGLITATQREITIQASIFLLALMLCAYSFTIITGRVIRPINNMAGALLQATRGEPVTFLPPTGRKDEIGILANVLHAFQQNVEHIKRTSVQLVTSQEHLRAVVDTAVDGVILVDKQGIVRMFNPACVRLFGYQPEETIGKNVNLLMPLSFEREHAGIVQEAAGRRKDGSTFPMELSVGEAKPGGETVFVGIIRDLTDRKRTAQQLFQAQKMEAVGQLTGGVAHDFNNLLTVILANADTLFEELSDREDLRPLAEMTRTAAERGAELTNSLLAFSRRQNLEPKAVDINKLVAGMDGLLRRALGENIEIRLVQGAGLWRATVDPGQLESGILNLAINARDAMPEGGRLTIEASNTHIDESYSEAHDEVKPGQYVLICVSDTGTGMSDEVAARAFEPFFSTKDVGKGTGLGLSMVYGFVKQSGGHIKIYSEVGDGTTFKIYLPRSSMDWEAAGTEPVRKASHPTGTETILMVEDNDLVRQHTEKQLQALGYNVLVASDGPAAMKILERGDPIDLLFTDVVMPGGMGGRQLAENAAALRPSLKILFTSGYTENAVVHHGRLGAGAHLLRKPYQRRELALKLRQLLGPVEHG